MQTDHKITIDIPDEIFAGIVDFKKKAHLTDNNSAIFELIKYALSFSPYFKNFNWEKAEKAAANEIKSSRVEHFFSVDDFLSDLKA